MALTLDELEERVDTELGSLRYNQLTEINRATDRETAAKTFRKEVRTRLAALEAGQAQTNERLATIESDVGDLKSDVADLKIGQASILKALELLLSAQGLDVPGPRPAREISVTDSKETGHAP